MQLIRDLSLIVALMHYSGLSMPSQIMTVCMMPFFKRVMKQPTRVIEHLCSDSRRTAAVKGV